MIQPKDFQLSDFLPDAKSREYRSLECENFGGSELVDNLILLRFVELADVQEVLQEKYNMPFAWLNMDPTPPEYREIADRNEVFIQRDKEVVVYIQLGATLDEALFQVDIPNYKIVYRYIADCNYQLVKEKKSAKVLSLDIAPFRPVLVLKRLIMDCIEKCGTDIHFESSYVDKVPMHRVRYRIKRELKDSEFSLDKALMLRVIQTSIDKLSPNSAMDLESAEGVSTEIADLFRDGTCDLRITGNQVSAGLYVVIAIQTTMTTTKTVDELGFPKEDVELIRQLAKRRTGLTLVTGEMRSGKNTTIFAMLNEIINDPIRIIEYSNPIENRMPYPQINYRGDIERLKNLMRLAKKQDIDLAVLNEIPNAEVAFAVRDLVNSAIGVITTTHLNRAWHLPNKLREFFGDDYKTIISQLNAVINHKMFLRWSGQGMQKRILVKEQGDFEMFAYRCGVRQYFVPQDISKVTYELQPLVEIIVMTDEIKSAMLNFDEMFKAEQMLQNRIEQAHAKLENKVAEYINGGLCSLKELERLY